MNRTLNCAGSTVLLKGVVIGLLAAILVVWIGSVNYRTEARRAPTATSPSMGIVTKAPRVVASVLPAPPPRLVR